MLPWAFPCLASAGVADIRGLVFAGFPVYVSMQVCMRVRAPVHGACEGRADVSTRGRNREEDCAVFLLQHLGHLLYN